MKRTLCSDWLAERARWAYLARFVPTKAKFFDKSFIDQVCLVKTAEFWPRSFFFGFLRAWASSCVTGTN